MLLCTEVTLPVEHAGVRGSHCKESRGVLGVSQDFCSQGLIPARAPALSKARTPPFLALATISEQEGLNPKAPGSS